MRSRLALCCAVVAGCGARQAAEAQPVYITEPRPPGREAPAPAASDSRCTLGNPLIAFAVRTGQMRQVADAAALTWLELAHASLTLHAIDNVALWEPDPGASPQNATPFDEQVNSMRAADAHYRSLTASAGVKPARWDGRDLSGLACFPRLEHLELQFNGIEQLQEVSSLRQLRFLAVGPPPPVSDSDKGMEGVLSNKPKDLGFLRSLSTLRELHLGSLSLESLSTLPALPALQTLSLQDNHLVDIALLATFTSLEKLYLGHNRLTTIRPLAALIRLKELDVSGNELSSTVDFDKARAAALIEETKRQGLDSTPLDVFGLVSGTKLDLSFNRLCAEGAVGLTWLLWAEVIGKDVQNC